MRLIVLLLAAVLGLALPPATLASQPSPQQLALSLADVGPGFESARDPEPVQLPGPVWLLDVAFARDFQVSRELGGPMFVGNRVVVADREIPEGELAVFTDALVVNLRMLEWEPSATEGPQIGDATVWLWAQREIEGIPIQTYTVAFRMPTALAMVQTVGAVDSSSRADAENLAQIVAARLTALPIPPRPTGRFFSADHRFSIEFPNEWERLDNQIGVVVTGMSPVSPETARLRPNCSVVVEPIPPGISLEQYTESALNTLGQATLDFRSEERTTGTLGGNPAAMLVSSFTLPQFEGMRVRVLQYAALPSDRAYVVTCTALEDQFSALRPQFEAVAASFHFE